MARTKCPRCGNKIAPKQRFCPECAFPIWEVEHMSDSLVKHPLPFRLSDGQRRMYSNSKAKEPRGTKIIFLIVGVVLSLALLAVFVWQLNDAVSVLKTGKELHDAFLELTDSGDNHTMGAANRKIERFCRSDKAPAIEIETIDISEKGQSVQAWYDDADGTVYWYTDSGSVRLNENAAGMFSGFTSLREADFTGIDTGNVTDMRSMFYDCASLSSLDLSSFNTGNVTDMSWMFYGCSNLSSLDLSGFDTKNVTNMSNMFAYCSSLEEPKTSDKKIHDQYSRK